ncbi:sce7725 family protein [Paenibacillus sp. HW567]|uniref:sce7725 family protein n=1 Tax=Paenibacillus sp. HW567 TaxID=1034769 RepID=UPI00037BAFD3|nr:sce7725 family protein [Paenibacillus sp. HW567]
MYFPYLRGRQNELLAIRELLDRECIRNGIIPVIEPVKLSSTLIKTMEYFIDRGQPLTIIHNPKVGTFTDDLKQLVESPLKDSYTKLMTNDKIIKGHILNRNSSGELTNLQAEGIKRADVLMICEDRDMLDSYGQEINDNPAKYHFIPDESAFKRKLRTNRVLLDDKFTKQIRNVDYIKSDDEFFSEDHLYYREEGYVGFSDYSIVGKPYSESGFAPFAIAIHIVYFDSSYNLRIKHFVSDSNEDLNDPAGKFYEAITKLYKWYEMSNIKTYGLDRLVRHFEAGTYPGLGIVKKLSIMHHLELVSQYLDGVR